MFATSCPFTAVTPGAPTLKGLDPNKAEILPFTVQAAFNDDTMFFHMSWEGDKGDTHDYFRFTNGKWQKEGGTRREGQATIDNDPIRGPTDQNSTIYESRVVFMLNDPTGPNAVQDFDRFGCFITCHDNSRAMPLWKESDGEVHKYLPDDHPGRLDMWHHRLARANPVGESDDQWVGQRINGEGDGGGGSRHGDDGDGPWKTGKLDANGNPPWVFDPSSTGGLFAFKFDDLFTSPLRYIVDPADINLGPNAPNPVSMDYADAIAAGYVPSEGDTVPRRRLRKATGSHGDISALGTTFTPSASDPLFGRWDSNIQRALNTGHNDDTAMAEGNIYNIAFAVHLGMVTVRDHYVSFPYTLSLNGGSADIMAVKLAGSGKGTLPDFSDTNTFPVTNINLFLPGINSYDFLIGQDVGKSFIDPATGTAVEDTHGGTAGLTMQGLGCRDCHVAAKSETFSPTQPGGFLAGAMEDLADDRGGVNTVTPLPSP